MTKRWVKGLGIPVILVLTMALAGCCLWAEWVKADKDRAEKVPPAEVMAAELRALQAAAQAEGALLPIYFDFDKSNLKSEAKANLDKTAAWLSKNSTVKIKIEGNCDERGTNEYNMALGERRANSAKEYLVNLGVATNRLETMSWGEEKPLDPGHDEAAWAKNRRDDFNPTSK